MLGRSHVEYVGEVGDRDKNELMGEASALLFPIDWPEPFGLVMIEAMACGTPVIAWDKGAVREIVDEGVTGFIVGSIEDAVAAVGKLHTIDRRRVRSTFERRFSAETMAKNYSALYARLTAAATRHAAVVHA
jgi:glycosyltransferase involved in cell wall biosynthesis